MPLDLLVTRLELLDEADLQSLIVGGLRLPAGRTDCLSQGELVELCGRELRLAGGFTSANLIRRMRNEELRYKQLLIDVADKLAPGITPLSWTEFRLDDDHSEEEIEIYLLELFEERARKWWDRLPVRKRAEFVDGLNTVLGDVQQSTRAVKPNVTPFLQQQAIENLIQAGLVTGLSKVSAAGLLGVAGVSVIGQLGWVLLVHTVGWMSGLKIAVFGIGGYGAMGGAVTFLGTTAVGAALAIPGLVFLLDGPAYRKTVPTIIMLLAKTRMNNLTVGPEDFS